MPWDPETSEWVHGPGSWCKTEVATGQAGNGEETVITIPSAAKNAILINAPSLGLPVRQKGEAILQGIHNTQVASLFGSKDAAVSDAPFRLVKRTIARQRHRSLASADSYIALSYCWHNPTWSTAGKVVGGSATESNIPISQDIFETILNERRSDDEGVWIDQLCINQNDPKEKAVAIGAMDVIYQRARLVAVVIEDITITKTEILALQSVLDTTNRGGGWQYRDYLDTYSRTLTKLTWKIFSARWFTRAWCGHELLMSTNQVFFIPAEPDEQCRPTVVKMSSEFLLDLCILAKSVSSVLPFPEFASSETTYGRSLARFYTYTLSRLNPGRRPIKESKSVTPSYMRTFSQVFGFHASVVSDKLSIVLNVLQCGLYLKDSSMTQEHCLYALYHLALSAKDPTCLSTCGKSLRQASWMRWPRGNDIIEPYTTGSRHLCLEITPTFRDDAIEIDLVILGTVKSVNRAKPSHLAWAEAVVNKCAELAAEFSDKGSEFPEDIIQTSKEALVRRQFYSELLACTHEFGIEWLEESWQLKDPDLMDPDIIQGLGRLMVADAQDIDAFVPSQWDDLIPIQHLIDGLIAAWIVEEPGTMWRPAWLDTNDSPSGVLLFLCPDVDNCSVAIPALLLRAEHSFLKRVWFISPKTVDNISGKDCNVVGKSSSFGRVALEDVETQFRVETHRVCM